MHQDHRMWPTRVQRAKATGALNIACNRCPAERGDMCMYWDQSADGGKGAYNGWRPYPHARRIQLAVKGRTAESGLPMAITPPKFSTYLKKVG